MEKPPKLKLLAVAIIISTLVATSLMSLLLYKRTVALLTSNLQQRLLSIATTAVPNIDPVDVDALQSEKDYKKPEWVRVVSQMAKMRMNNKDIIFMYIFRKSKNDPSKMVFVADSHSINPYANINSNVNYRVDPNGDGVINDTDVLQWPGQPYDPPAEGYEAYNGPTTNKELYSDSYGTYISGYAPIKDNKNNIVGILAADVRADDFSTITTQTLIPFVAFIVGLLIVILVLAYSLIKLWNKQVKLVEELDRQKDELLSIVSHQLATPVTAVNYYLEMLLDGDLGKVTDEQAEHLKSMRSVTAKLVDLIGMILDVSRIQLGKMKVDKQDLDLNVFFKELMQVIEPKAAEKGTQFRKSIPEKLPVTKLDKRLTNMTLENLLSNAVKYTPASGKVEFTVEIKEGKLYCTIKDTGVGVPEKDQPKLFDKLFRASNVRNTVDGNGFGLYVAKGAVEGQGGKISFKSIEGKGTTFFVELPLNG